MSMIGGGVLQQKKFSFEWKIERFFADCKNAGDFHRSAKSEATLSIGYANQITNWYLEVYPRGFDDEDGDNANSKNHVSLFINYESENIPEVTVDYEILIVSENSDLRQQGTHTFKGPEDNWGFYKFVEHNLIQDPNTAALVNDTLKIFCEMTFHQIHQNGKKRINEYENLLDNIGKGFENYEELLESNYYTDVTFNIQNQKIYLHKAILMCRNSVFKAMFEHKMKESKESTVDIVDVDFTAMKELFRFIYSGKVENIEKIVKDLLIAADKYCVIELKALCEKTLYHNLTVDNAIEYLKLTEKCDTIQLKKLLIDFVVHNMKDIVQKSDFNLMFADLDQEVVCEIMKVIAEKCVVPV